MHKFPKLILPQFCNTDIRIIAFSDDADINGLPLEITVYEGKCNYQSISKRIWTRDKYEVIVSGTCLIGDTFDEFASGYAEINGERREIASVSGVRNPDGTFNYMKVELK